MGKITKYKIQEFNGIKYYKKPNGYYKSSRKKGGDNYMHRDVWEFYNGKIKDGFVVHHKNHDKADNRIENLQLLSSSVHTSLHGKLRMQKGTEKTKKHMAAMQEKAKLWHASLEGLAWHKEHGKKSWANKTKIKNTCSQCKKIYEVYEPYIKRSFCSASCQNRARILSGVDDEKRECEMCSKEFMHNKYLKKKYCSKGCLGKSVSIRRKNGSL